MAHPISLATTFGISVDFFSSGYLDVSVLQVCHIWSIYSINVDPLRTGFPHSDTFGSMLVCQLPEAFRRLPRPSSPVIAKASTTCTYLLDPITLITYNKYFKVKLNLLHINLLIQLLIFIEILLQWIYLYF